MATRVVLGVVPKLLPLYPIRIYSPLSLRIRGLRRLVKERKIEDKYPLKACKFPKFYRWGCKDLPSYWSFGWETGKDNNLICVKPNILSEIAGEINLSPVCSNRFLAGSAFIMKVILVRIDHNLRGL